AEMENGSARELSTRREARIGGGAAHRWILAVDATAHLTQPARDVRLAFRQRDPPRLQLPNAARRSDARHFRGGKGRPRRAERLREILVAEDSHRRAIGGRRRY